MRRRGFDHPRASIPDRVVREMRDVYHAWKEAGTDKGYETLGRIYGISSWTARDIVTYRTRIDA